MALPTAFFAMVASFALASAGGALDGRRPAGHRRDHDSKNAIAAADAGANVALLRLNRYSSSLSTHHPCVGRQRRKLTDAASTTAGARRPREAVGGATYSYRVSAYAGTGALHSVVATGTSGDGQPAGRGRPSSTTNGQERLRRRGPDRPGRHHPQRQRRNPQPTSAPTATSSTMQTAATICGNIRHGIGKKARRHRDAVQRRRSRRKATGRCRRSAAMPTDIATNNCQLPACAKMRRRRTMPVGQTRQRSDKQDPWDAQTTNRSTSANSATLTLGGGDYFICRLD